MSTRFPQQTRGRPPEAAHRLGDRVAALLMDADLRDQAAERRDRDAELHGTDPRGFVERFLAGRDRDAAAVDRAELVALIGELVAVLRDPPRGDGIRLG